jgi:hypothetical protein
MKTERVMLDYLIKGKPVGRIANDLNTNRALIRRSLKEGGVTLLPKGNSYLLGRGSVCDAVNRAGYVSFHTFVQVKGLDPINEQATFLKVSEKALTRVYNSYRHLLNSLKTAGVILPTSQLNGVNLEYREIKRQPK